MTREDLVAEFISYMSDAFPYDDPNYESMLLTAAGYYADDMLDPNSEINRLCREHDELLTNNDIL